MKNLDTKLFWFKSHLGELADRSKDISAYRNSADEFIKGFKCGLDFSDLEEEDLEEIEEKILAIREQSWKDRVVTYESADEFFKDHPDMFKVNKFGCNECGNTLYSSELLHPDRLFCPCCQTSNMIFYKDTVTKKI